MKCEKYIWIALIAVTFLGTTSEARLRRKSRKAKVQSDDPETGVENQQPPVNYDEYGIDYDYPEEHDENGRRFNHHLTQIHTD